MSLIRTFLMSLRFKATVERVSSIVIRLFHHKMIKLLLLGDSCDICDCRMVSILLCLSLDFGQT